MKFLNKSLLLSIIIILLVSVCSCYFCNNGIKNEVSAAENNHNIITKEDYIGEFCGERWDMSIKKNGIKYKVSGHQSYSAFEGRDFEYECDYVEYGGYLYCKNAETTHYYYCRGEIDDSGTEFYSECKATYPKQEVKVSKKIYSDIKLVLTKGDPSFVFFSPDEGTYIKDLILVEYASGYEEPCYYAKSLDKDL